MFTQSVSLKNYDEKNHTFTGESNRLLKCRSIADALQTIVDISDYNVSNFAVEADLDVGYFDKMYNGRKRLNSCITFAKIVNVAELTAEEVMTFTNLFLIQEN